MYCSQYGSSGNAVEMKVQANLVVNVLVCCTLKTKNMIFPDECLLYLTHGGACRVNVWLYHQYYCKIALALLLLCTLEFVLLHDALLFSSSLLQVQTTMPTGCRSSNVHAVGDYLERLPESEVQDYLLSSQTLNRFGKILGFGQPYTYNEYLTLYFDIVLL